MRAAALFLIICFSGFVFSEEALYLHIDSRDDGVLVSIENRSGDSVTINSRFFLGDQFFIANEVALEIFDSKGDVYAFLPKVQASKIKDDDYSLLKKDHLSGIVIASYKIKELYGLSQGKYKIRAVYVNSEGKSDVFKGKLKSNEVELAIN